MMKWCYTILAALLTVPSAHGYSSGRVPIDACMGGPFGHGVPPQSSSAPFNIEIYHLDSTPATDYREGETLNVELSSTDGQPFKGFLIWAQEEGDVCSVGEWAAAPFGQTTRECKFFSDVKRCNDGLKNALAHSEKLGTTKTNMEFRVPLGFSGVISFRAHVVRHREVFWSGVSSTAIAQAATTTSQPAQGAEQLSATGLPSFTPPAETVANDTPSVFPNQFTTTFPPFEPSGRLPAEPTGDLLLNDTTTPLFAQATGIFPTTPTIDTLQNNETAPTTNTTANATTQSGLFLTETVADSLNLTTDAEPTRIGAVSNTSLEANGTSAVSLLTENRVNDTFDQPTESSFNLTAQQEVNQTTVGFEQPAQPQEFNATTVGFDQPTQPQDFNATTVGFEQPAQLSNDTLTTSLTNFTTDSFVGQPVDPSTNLTTDSLFGQPTSQPINFTTDFFGQTTDTSTNTTFDSFLEQSTGLPINFTTDAFGQPAGSATNLTTDFFGQPTEPPTNNTVMPDQFNTTTHMSNNETFDIPTLTQPILNTTTAPSTDLNLTAFATNDSTTEAILENGNPEDIPTNLTTPTIAGEPTEQFLNTTTDLSQNITNVAQTDIPLIVTTDNIFGQPTEPELNATTPTATNVTEGSFGQSTLLSVNDTTSLPTDPSTFNITETSISFNNTDAPIDLPVTTDVGIEQLLNATEPEFSSTTSSSTNFPTSISDQPTELVFNVTTPSITNITEDSSFNATAELPTNLTTELSFNATDMLTNLTTEFFGQPGGEVTDVLSGTEQTTIPTIFNDTTEANSTIDPITNFTTAADIETTSDYTSTGVPEILANQTNTDSPSLNTGSVDENSNFTTSSFTSTTSTTESTSTSSSTSFTTSDNSSGSLIPGATEIPEIRNQTIEEGDLGTTGFNFSSSSTSTSSSTTTVGDSTTKNVSTDSAEITTVAESTEVTTLETSMETDSEEFTSTTAIPTTTTTTTRATTTTQRPTTTTKVTTAAPTTPAVPIDSANQPKVVSFKLKGDYDTLVDTDYKTAVQEITTQLADIMKIAESRIQNLKLSKGSVNVEFTLAPGEENSVQTADAIGDLQTFLEKDNKGLSIKGEELPMAPGSLKTSAVQQQQEEEVVGLPLTTKIVLAVVFGLIGIAIIVAIIVICMRQRKSHGFLMMRAARKDYGIPLRTMETGNGRNGASNGQNGSNGNHNHGYSRA